MNSSGDPAPRQSYSSWAESADWVVCSNIVNLLIVVSIR
jgi:hypothetical protein